MSKTKISMEEFEFLTRRAGLTFLSDKQKEECYSAYSFVEAMTERLHKPRPREAEPALIFTFPEETA